MLQCFDASLIAEAQILAVPLGSEDLRRGECLLDAQGRVARIQRALDGVKPAFPVDHKDTLAYVLFDGSSASESFFMEALYNHGGFPCLFVGGSAGGKGDGHTLIHDGKRLYEDHALIALVKVAPGMRFGVLKSQNFAATATSFHVIHADVAQRTISDVIDGQGRLCPLIDALCEALQCPEGGL